MSLLTESHAQIQTGKMQKQNQPRGLPAPFCSNQTAPTLYQKYSFYLPLCVDVDFMLIT